MIRKIPVIGVPIVNGVQWLERLIDTIDYPVKDLFIINNSACTITTSNISNLINNKKSKYIDRIFLCNLPGNIGCSASWNLIIKSYIMAPYWIISNHDIGFTPGFLQSLVELAEDQETGIVFGKGEEIILEETTIVKGCWDIFLIKDFAVQKYGLFDENFFPAYSEDIDYMFRTMVDPIKMNYSNVPYFHGETTDYAISGSQTWRQDFNLKTKLYVARWINEHGYMPKKWGPDWQQWKLYKNPFNKPDIGLNMSYFDIYFARSKYLGF